MQRILWKITLLAMLYFAMVFEAKAEDWLISIGYASIPGGTVAAQRYSSSGNANIWMGVPQAINRYQGMYLSASLPEDVWSSRTNRESNSHTLVNAGLSFNPTHVVTLYAGPGFSYQRTRYGPDLETRHRYRLNGNVGAIFRVGNFGVNLSYDTAPQAFGVGFVMRSSAFQ